MESMLRAGNDAHRNESQTNKCRAYGTAVSRLGYPGYAENPVQ
jgi:hypothetical protein